MWDQIGENTMLNPPEFTDLGLRSGYSRFSVLDKRTGKGSNSLFHWLTEIRNQNRSSLNGVEMPGRPWDTVRKLS